jgi:hypothetical protein
MLDSDRWYESGRFVFTACTIFNNFRKVRMLDPEYSLSYHLSLFG